MRHSRNNRSELREAIRAVLMLILILIAAAILAFIITGIVAFFALVAINHPSDTKVIYGVLVLW